MAYFGGGGVVELHPSLQAYIDCFKSPPFPKMFPRGGGIWEQDPILMRDFRAIRDYEVRWKESQEQLRQAQQGDHPNEIGGEGGLENLLDEYVQQLEDGEPL